MHFTDLYNMRSTVNIARAYSTKVQKPEYLKLIIIKG